MKGFAQCQPLSMGVGVYQQYWPDTGKCILQQVDLSCLFYGRFELVKSAHTACMTCIKH